MYITVVTGQKNRKSQVSLGIFLDFLAIRGIKTIIIIMYKVSKVQTQPYPTHKGAFLDLLFAV